jgi:hypothetical protein
MKKKTAKKIKLSSETLYQLQTEKALVGVPGTPNSGIGCCP